jgi:hypothetical protein
MKTIILIALLASAAWAQTPSCIQITDTLYTVGVSAPVPMTGTIDISLGYTASDGALVIAQSGMRRTVAAGVVNVCLPPGAYTAQYSVKRPVPLTGTISFTRFWAVPSSGGPYTVSAIETLTVLPHLSLLTLVRNEVPIYSGSGATWTLLDAPSSPAAATCWRNGLHQATDIDYTLSGNTLTALGSPMYWDPINDQLVCDYQY